MPQRCMCGSALFFGRFEPKQICLFKICRNHALSFSPALVTTSQGMLEKEPLWLASRRFAGESVSRGVKVVCINEVINMIQNVLLMHWTFCASYFKILN